MTDAALLPDDWPPYVVVSVGRDPDAGEGHDHVVAIDTRDPDGGETQWRSQEVILAIRDGERFVVDGDGGAQLQPGACPACGRTTLTSDVPRSTAAD